ncbi:MAG TPA: hypothetical protein VFM99_10530 [Chitinophagales bacterium]|nr:hypothetical protein [Chitinophagales bacterium]
MSLKIFIADLIASIISFLLGWSVNGILLKDYFEGALISYDGLYKENINLIAIAINQLAAGLLLAYMIGNFSGPKTGPRGALIGGIVGL